MEYCAGKTVLDYLHSRNRCQDTPVDSDFNLSIFKQLTDGLVEVHNNDVLHRDLKPENILLNQNVAKIGDFGLALQLGGQDDRSVAGTEAYLPPELKQHFANGTKPEQ